MKSSPLVYNLFLTLLRNSPTDFVVEPLTRVSSWWAWSAATTGSRPIRPLRRWPRLHVKKITNESQLIRISLNENTLKIRIKFYFFT